MKITYKLNDRITVEAEADDQKSMFKALGALSEVFGEECCGACKSKDIRFQVRNVDGNDFYEMKCQNPKCRARLGFGQNKAGGTLFPRKWDSEAKKQIGAEGWEKYTPQAVTV